MEGGEGLRHSGKRTAIRGQGVCGLLVILAVQEPHLRSVWRFSAETEPDRENTDSIPAITVHFHFLGGKKRTYPRYFKTGPADIRTNWYMDPYAYAVSINDLCSLGRTTSFSKHHSSQRTNCCISTTSSCFWHTWASRTMDVPHHNVLPPYGCLLLHHELTVHLDIFDLITQNDSAEEWMPK